MTTEQRISRLEGAYEQVDKRLDDLNQSIGGLRSEMDSLRSEMRGEMGGLRGEMGSLRSEMNSRINTLTIVMFGTWVTVIGAVIGLYFA